MEALSTAIREGKEIKAIQIGKEEVKHLLFEGDMILYTENTKDATKKLLELINELSKVSGYKINTQNSVVLLYTNNKRSGKEINKIIPFTIATKGRKCLGTNLSKEAKDL